MFEKEAEEYQIRKHHQRLYGHKLVVMKELNTTFKDGAELGYKKGFEECAKARLNTTTISDCPIKDEWHYVKNKDFPVKEDYYVIACHSATGDFTDRCQWLNNEWWDADGETKHFINEKVYAWKEKSEPPEEI